MSIDSESSSKLFEFNCKCNSRCPYQHIIAMNSTPNRLQYTLSLHYQSQSCPSLILEFQTFYSICKFQKYFRPLGK